MNRFRPLFIEKLSLTFLIFFLLGFLTFIDLPGKIYFLNTVEFRQLYGFYLPTLLIWAVLTLLGGIGIFLFIPIRYYRNLILIPFTLAVLTWIQSNILNWQYGPLDGTPIEWNNLWYFGAIDLSIWIIAIALIIRFREIFYRHAKKIVMVLILTSVVSYGYYLTSYLAVTSEVISRSLYELDETKPIHFSKNKNVILILPDTMQSDATLEVLNETGSNLAKYFEGFTFYRNSLAPSNGTFISVPAILTGEVFENDTPYPRYIKKSFSKRSLPRVLSENGYRCFFHEFIDNATFLSLNPDFIENLVLRNPTDVRKDALYLLDLSVFRMMPHYFKTYVYNEHNWLLSKGTPTQSPQNKKTERKKKSFSADTFSDSQADIDAPVFRFLHYEGSHVPFNRSRTGKKLPPRNTFESFKDKTYLALTSIIALLNRLKEIHAYDNSLIIIIGDHGYSAADDWSKGNIGKGMGMNALMIKDFGAKSPFKVTDQPIASSDIPRYVFERLGLDSVSEDLNPPAVSNQQNFRRFFIRGLRKEEYVYHGYSEYIVMGHTWDDKSWIKYHKHPPGKNIKLCIFNKRNKVTVIDKIDFQQKASSTDKDLNNSIHKLISITRIKDNDAEFIIKKPKQIPSFLNVVFSVGHLEPRLEDPHALVTYQINDRDPIEVYSNRGGLTFGFSWDVIIPRKDQEYPLTIKFHFCFGEEEDCREGKISQPFVYGSLAVFGIEKK